MLILLKSPLNIPLRGFKRIFSLLHDSLTVNDVLIFYVNDVLIFNS